ncbi:SDR family NAD(P)-dependent oxidoreductase [Pseudonocardia parietis]|uniref:NAD(P)-dependent dehydrogenase (Short-subunit alcohol dehydrogenase family) n=1 Tax=Pseudonocardia parietis TaxID=570936 RepID=A0ABS4W0L5_9PSEU|nr:SDR family NAD(P)-dependent oxidoreductase [Pseudonocardia parietis]MBP2369488.1 NAD(P)-dependent dehydrogenase (short-subunit alcohol dehydrogenase family) [Pseudonocardia parietis]
MPTALVTGGSRGLGEAYARELAERGYSIVLVARDADRLAATAERIGRATGAIVETLAADLTDPAGPAAVERRIADPAPPIELLVNNAGAEAEATTAAVLRLTRAAASVMAARGRGGILNVAGPPPSSGNDHDAAQSWVPAFTGTVAASLQGTGVTVTAVDAGRIRGHDDPAGPPWTELRMVVRRSLDDLDRGRTLSAPGRLHRALTGCLASPRTALRLAAKVAGRERCARPEPHHGAGHTRPSPVPTPFRDAPALLRLLPAGAAALPALPELPARPAHVPAEGAPAPRELGSGPLPVVRAAPARGTVVRRLPAPPRPVQQPVRGGATVRLATG